MIDNVFEYERNCLYWQTNTINFLLKSKEFALLYSLSLFICEWTDVMAEISEFEFHLCNYNCFDVSKYSFYFQLDTVESKTSTIRYRS